MLLAAGLRQAKSSKAAFYRASSKQAEIIGFFQNPRISNGSALHDLRLLAIPPTPIGGRGFSARLAGFARFVQSFLAACAFPTQLVHACTNLPTRIDHAAPRGGARRAQTPTRNVSYPNQPPSRAQIVSGASNLAQTKGRSPFRRAKNPISGQISTK